MLSKNIQGVKKARPSWKHQLALIHSYIRLKSMISGGGQGQSYLLAAM